MRNAQNLRILKLNRQVHQLVMPVLILFCLVALSILSSSGHKGFISLVPTGSQAIPKAKLEPEEGCYIGAFLGFNPNEIVAISEFEGKVSKKHASYIYYSGYGQPFPKEIVEEMKKHDAIPQLAWEPNAEPFAEEVAEEMKKHGQQPPLFPEGTNGLEYVRDDWYLRQWAREAREAGCPIFLRFASEMNGAWVAYGDDPELYKEKFRLVHDVMEEEASNVAMVWTVFTFPARTIKSYYPGDEYVDWVGINIYMVHHHDGDLSKPAHDEDPLDFLNLVYKNWAERKPIQISEYAATHYCGACQKNYHGFAKDRMHRMYDNLKKLFPRVKAIFWFNADALTHGKAENNYNVTNYPDLLAEYRKCVSDPYFLSTVVGRKSH